MRNGTFLSSLFIKLSLCTKYFSQRLSCAKWSKRKRLQTAILAARFSIKTFLIQQKISLEAFSVKLVKMRRAIHAPDSHSLGGAYFLKTVLNHKKFFGRIRPSWLSSCAAILIGGSWKRFVKGPSFHTGFWAFFVCALTASVSTERLNSLFL